MTLFSTETFKKDTFWRIEISACFFFFFWSVELFSSLYGILIYFKLLLMSAISKCALDTLAHPNDVDDGRIIF